MRIEDITSEKIEIQGDAQRKCIFSPICTWRTVNKALDDQYTGFQIYDKMRYAQDNILLARTHEYIQPQINKIVIVSEE